MPSDSIPEHVDLLGNPNQVIKWLEGQDENLQQSQAFKIFDGILGEAAQPRSVSGNACVRLCGFVERASKAESGPLVKWAFSQDVTFKLYEFYIDWNEFDHHRSMRLVLDLIAHQLGKNPDKKTALEIRDSLLDNLISIVIGRTTKPVAKSALKTLDYLLAKRVFNLDDIKSKHISYHEELFQSSDIEIWRTFFSELFSWTKLHIVCPAAGKFIVNLYRCLRQRNQERDFGLSIETWHKWLLDFLVKQPTLLENFKNYIFLPLFKTDRPEALEFLQQMSNIELASISNEGFDTAALLNLAALEAGKKVGLVEEPYLGAEKQASKDTAIILRESVLESVLTHPSHEVRASALTLLISSPSTTRPYSSTTLDLLKKHLAAFFADPDAKFRVDVCARARDMFKRVRGAISVLKRSIPRAKAKARKNASGENSISTSQPIIYRANLISLPESQLEAGLGYHEDFLYWYLNFLCAELSPTSSYQRHITSLKCLIFILRLEGDSSKPWETADDQTLFFDRIDSKWKRGLCDLVMNPFDDVRELSSQALERILSDRRYRLFSFGTSETDGNLSNELNELLTRADKLSVLTARADHADGVARASRLFYRFLHSERERIEFLSSLVESLESKISAAEADLGKAVLGQSLHNDFASLCHTWQVVSDQSVTEIELASLNALQDRLVACCERTWRAVRDVLCDDSPEGHLPQELEDTEGLDTKNLLSYSFRAIHESSNFMRTLVFTMRNGSREGFISPSTKVFETIGNLTFEQLASLRHRGAFTTVASTFATCCQLSKHLGAEAGQSLLELWYKGSLNEIFTQASTTRRSAGIPSMITGILTANASHPSFEEVMEKLIEIANIPAQVKETDGSHLPQVHAYNCLKDIFKNSLLTSLGNKSEKYLSQCLELAASGLRSEVWAIRNCGLIFLRSLIDNLFGSQESKSMIETGWDGKANRIPYHRYPTLPKVLANLLMSGHEMVSSTTAASSAESVFPALDIIRRAGPPDSLRDEIQVHVAAYLSSPVWHVREIAARTLCSCLLHDKWLEMLKSLFLESFKGTTSSSQNHVHGVILALKFVFERLSEVSLDRLLVDLPHLTSFLDQAEISLRYHNCPDIVASYQEVINMIWMFQISNSLPLQPRQTVVPAIRGGALLRVQNILNGLIRASQEEDSVPQTRKLLLGSQIAADTLVAALEMMPNLWQSISITDTSRLDLCTLYIDICLKTTFTDAHVVAIDNLAELIDQLFQRGKLQALSTSPFLELWATLPLRSLNPALSNAIIRVSGGIVSVMQHAQRLPKSSLQNWGFMMADSGLDDKSFDTRFAAVNSLNSFFSITHQSCNSEEYLPALLSLYDALNDDDEEVREVGSAAAKHILGQSLVPLEAANRLLQWLTLHFRTNLTFQSIVASRTVGAYTNATAVTSSPPPWPTADSQLSAALKFDDSLFAVEEQNLFVDEVRETNRWVAVLNGLDWKEQGLSAEILGQLTNWVLKGSERFKQLLTQEDGPLGWASNPHVFGICTRIIRGLVALENARSTPHLARAISDTRQLLESQDHGISKLLIEPLRDSTRSTPA